MNIVCPRKIDCPGSDWPTLNLSAEAPDQLYWSGTTYGYDPYQPPPLGDGLFVAYDCYGQVFSVQSQEIADLLAEITATYCNNPDPPQNPDNPDYPDAPAFCYNEAQTVSKTCSDGTVLSYTVQAGYIVNQIPNAGDADACLAAANAYALAYAKQQLATLKCPTPSKEKNCGAPGSKICLSELYGPCTTDATIILSLTASGSAVDLGNGLGAGYNIWRLLSGTLPPGLSLLVQNFFPVVDASGIPGGPTITLEGTPTTPGVYTFTVSVTSPSYNSPVLWAEKTYCVEVLASTSPGAAYSVTLTKPTCAGAGIATAQGGNLNPGLNWTQSIVGDDIISGTPTTAGTCMFNITYP